MLVKEKELERKIQNRLTTLINNEKWRWIVDGSKLTYLKGTIKMFEY